MSATPPGWRERLRREVIVVARDDGGVDLVDLVLERVTRFDPDAARALDGGDPEVLERLDEAELLEGPDAEDRRRWAWAARVNARAAPARARPSGGPIEADWSLAEALPPALIAPEWRRPERWRRLAEERAAGRRYLSLPGLLDEGAAETIAAQVAALPFVRLETSLVRAARHLLGAADVRPWLELMLDERLRALFGAVIARPLSPGLVVNAWRLDEGDAMGVHPDGRHYEGTLSLGLARGWSASRGGAIAFGEPRDGGFLVRERWLPQLGDALVFAPDGDTWHAVEPVRGRGPRHSLTGWWVAPEHGLTVGRG